ncbi:MAG: 4Fe-4S binding protein [Nitrososphaerota archaeon]|nr:4Fe-4S binding protein [Nitrososphaerales archaeon]MDW8045466.1 4Fe-4S binding protein [Nitrososphaerota archaeon]
MAVFNIIKHDKRYSLFIYEDLCKGCGICVWFCPSKVLSLSKEINKRGFHFAKLDDESKCTACKICELVCPDFSIGLSEISEISTSNKR